MAKLFHVKHLRFIIGVVLVSFCGHLSYSQMVGVSFEVDTIFGEGAVDSWGESLEGYVTFDLFAELTNPEDQLSAVYSDVVALNTPELYVEAACGCYNPALGDVLVGGSQNELLFDFFPSIEYDTYWTVGFADGEQAVLSNANYNSLSMCSETESGGLIFTITPVPAGDDLRVQFAQITTCGPFEVSACFQVFVNGINAPYQEFCLETDGGGNLEIQSPFLGCTETTACNYDPSAFEDDGSCVPSGCLDPDAVNYNSDAGCDSGDCVYGGADNCGPGTYWDVEELKCLPNPFICGEGTYWNQLLLQCLPFDNCPEDLDNDGQVAVSDLLLLLGAYSEICPLIQGCTDSNALNYNPNAEEDDGSCVFEIFGCTDEAACNFQPLANTDDGSCQEFDLCGICGGQGPQIGYDCDGECLNDEDGDGVCDEFEVFGCTNEEADNFDIDATEDDGSCLISGCTAPVACNYNPEADVDDGSCLAFDQCGVCGGSGFPDGTCDCEGALPEEGYDCFGICLYDEDGDGVCDEFEIPGCDSAGACNFDPEATDYDGTCEFPNEGYDCNGDCLIDSDGDGICDLFEIVGCQDVSACNYAAEATDSGECFEYDECDVCGGPGILNGACDCEGNIPETGYDCNGDCWIDSDGDGICDEYEIEGCTFSNACNYDEAATDDDGSCFFYCPGCTDSAACNYDIGALQDDGTCQYPIDLYGASNVDCEGNCISDEDGDGVCLEEEVNGCTDIASCNYESEATEDDGSCEYDSCAGCLIEEACNYSPSSTIENNSTCEFESCAGCMYEFACNYDPSATIAANETCEFGTCPGCTDPEACNYNPTVTEDDGGCEYPVEYYDCFEECLNDVNGNGVCDEIEILGCMNQGACNFNDLATVNDGSCLFADWGLLGFELNGEASGESSASSVSISYDGSVIAIGSPGATNTESVAAGQVRVFEWVSEQSAWTQKGDGIYGLGGWAQLGSSVSLSDDGNTLAVGAPYSDPDQNSGWHGSVGIYSWNDEMGQWIQQGDDIWGLEGDRAGYSVSLSSDGNSVVVGSPYNDDNGSDSGNVRVFQWDVFTSSWAQKGSNIVGEAEADNSGWSVSLSSNANTVAIGARFNAVNGNESGHVRIYYWLDSLGDWIQMGADIDSESEWDQFGHSVSLSSDGTIVAIGGQSNDSNGQDAGHVKVYQWVSEMLLWLQMGDDILGENIGDESGWSVSLSDDGNTLAVGSPGNDDSASDSGHVRIFHWDYEESNWTQQGTAIEGEAAVDRSGKSVAISGDGSTVLIGSPENDNSFFQAGQARAFIFGCN